MNSFCIRQIILISILFSAAACGPPARPPEPTNLFWPSPPDKPRIKYLQSIYGEDDIGRKYSVMEMLFGKEYDDMLSRPYGVTAGEGKILVSDLRRRSVIVFDLAARRQTVLGTEGGLQSPAAAVMDDSGLVYVAEASGNKVVVYTIGGEYRTTFTISNGKPVALAIDRQKRRLYVVDRSGHRVVVLSLQGEQLFSFGGQGNDDGQFNIPLGIALDGKDSVYVLDSGNFRVQRFDREGKFQAKFGAAGDRHGFFSNPKGIAVDTEGHIYVTDAAFSNIQVFNQEGDVLISIGRIGSAPGYLYLPAGISIDENDRIYVADQLNGRIQVFQYLK